MTLRFASHVCVLVGFVLILMGGRTTFAQAPDPGAAAAHPSRQQPSPDRPQVFFPMADQPQMEMHHHGQIPEVMPHFPRLGDSQRVVSGPIYQLEELERTAIASNPTLAQTLRAIEAARGHELQVGLYPNPVVGYIGEEIRGGSYGGGEQGFFVEQPIILGGKLGLNRKVGAAEVKERQAQVKAQKHRVENDVRTAYYHVLAAQERLAIERDLIGIAQTTVRIVRQLGNVGQADETEILEAESEEQRLEIAAGIAEHMRRRQWAMLVSVIGAPSLPEGGVAGRIDAEQAPLDEGQLLTSLLAQSPAVQSAQAGAERAEAALVRAKRENVPDLTLRGGLQQNYEPLSTPPNRKVGLQGFAEIGVHLHVWDRNQGGIAAETAGLEAARDEVRRVELTLRDHFAMYAEEYGSARLTAERYRIEILPRLERAYKLMTEQYGLMTASFIRVLMLQRMLYENETSYVDALERTWTSSIALRGFLLEGALMPLVSTEMQMPTVRIERQESMGGDIRSLSQPSNLISR
jgi:cobalt-zinc-cadmium efflux system outer membrane protein